MTWITDDGATSLSKTICESGRLEICRRPGASEDVTGRCADDYWRCRDDATRLDARFHCSSAHSGPEGASTLSLPPTGTDPGRHRRFTRATQAQQSVRPKVWWSDGTGDHQTEAFSAGTEYFAKYDIMTSQMVGRHMPSHAAIFVRTKE